MIPKFVFIVSYNLRQILAFERPAVPEPEWPRGEYCPVGAAGGTNTKIGNKNKLALPHKILFPSRLPTKGILIQKPDSVLTIQQP